MSFWAQTLGGVRKIVLLEDRVGRLEKTVDALGDDVRGHDRRLQQIETILFGPTPPDQLRLPRR